MSDSQHKDTKEEKAWEEKIGGSPPFLFFVAFVPLC
jgi:hypothetical protein